MQIRKILPNNPSEPLFAAHLPLHRGGYGDGGPVPQKDIVKIPGWDQEVSACGLPCLKCTGHPQPTDPHAMISQNRVIPKPVRRLVVGISRKRLPRRALALLAMTQGWCHSEE